MVFGVSKTALNYSVVLFTSAQPIPYPIGVLSLVMGRETENDGGIFEIVGMTTAAKCRFGKSEQTIIEKTKRS